MDLVVPVKELGRAKSRLAAVGDAVAASPAERAVARADLALALAADTLAAVLASSVARVVVVTSEPRAAAIVAEVGPRALVVPDPGRGLNAAVRAGVERLRDLPARPGGPSRVGALLADLPALRPAELDAALDAAGATSGSAFVADHTGEGTTLLVLGVDDGSAPHFGPGSAAAHRAVGGLPLVGDWPGLRHDVDVPGDLDRVRELGLGRATRAWVEAARPPAHL